MKRLRGFTCERERFKFFGRRTKGKRKTDHAFSVRVDVEGKFCYDSAMKSGSMPVARREVTKSGDSFCKKAGDEDLLADKKVSPE